MSGPAWYKAKTIIAHRLSKQYMAAAALCMWNLSYLDTRTPGFWSSRLWLLCCTQVQDGVELKPSDIVQFVLQMDTRSKVQQAARVMRLKVCRTDKLRKVLPWLHTESMHSACRVCSEVDACTDWAKLQDLLSQAQKMVGFQEAPMRSSGSPALRLTVK